MYSFSFCNVLLPKHSHYELATTHIKVLIFYIATYLNRSSQTRVMTETGRGVAWNSWNPRRNRCIIFNKLEWRAARYLDRSGGYKMSLPCCSPLSFRLLLKGINGTAHSQNLRVRTYIFFNLHSIIGCSFSCGLYLISSNSKSRSAFFCS